jgi:effector-binding domain-containing protein
MDETKIHYQQIEPVQVAALKTVIRQRADILPLFEPLRKACGEAVCGPAMAILHYGAVKDGLLVEAAFPVSRAVETELVHTCLLEARRAWTMVHHGPPATVRETTGKILEYIQSHAGTVGGGVREIYLTLDVDHPENNVTEIQVLSHEWDQRLAEGVEQVLGPSARQQVMTGIEAITDESSAEAYREWIHAAMSRLDTLTDDAEIKYKIVSCCAHVFPQERIDHLRSIYGQRGDIDDVLREMYTDPDWYESPVRKGNQLHMRKVPYNADAYQKATTPVERRQAYCHCAFVRPYLEETPARISPTFCWCGAGWYRRLWEGILDQPIQVEHVETLMKGNDQCTLIITLPLSLEGELSPEAVLPEAVLPEAVLPEAVLPEAVLPEAVLPEAVSPEAVSPEAVSP